MIAVRSYAVALALVLMGGEIVRSWGEHHVIWWTDDFLIGAGLIVTAFLLKRETPARRALFTGAWGFAAGVIYISFFDKVIAAQVVGPGVEINPLNLFVTVSTLAAIGGFVWSLRVPFRSAS